MSIFDIAAALIAVAEIAMGLVLGVVLVNERDNLSPGNIAFVAGLVFVALYSGVYIIHAVTPEITIMNFITAISGAASLIVAFESGMSRGRRRLALMIAAYIFWVASITFAEMIGMRQ